MLPPGDPRRAHFEAQAERYAKLSGEQGRDLAAYLARRRELVADRDQARAKAEAAAELAERRRREAALLRREERWNEAAATDHEATEQRDEAADWREAAALAHLALVDLRRP